MNRDLLFDDATYKNLEVHVFTWRCAMNMVREDTAKLLEREKKLYKERPCFKAVLSDGSDKESIIAEVRTTGIQLHDIELPNDVIGEEIVRQFAQWLLRICPERKNTEHG